MCIICISDKGIRQPDKATIKAMWTGNPHGAGYMYYRDGKVYTRKGFMELDDLLDALNEEQFTDDDIVVYHFRISTQGGVNPAMTQPFFFTKDIVKTKELASETKLGIAHNGIIPMTTYKDNEYSDTAHFIAEYLPIVVRNTNDLRNEHTLELLGELLQSKMVFLDCKGRITKVGNFLREKDGLVYSNSTYKTYKYYYNGRLLQTI